MPKNTKTSCFSLRIMQRSCSSRESSAMCEEPLKSGTYKFIEMTLSQSCIVLDMDWI